MGVQKPISAPFQSRLVSDVAIGKNPQTSRERKRALWHGFEAHGHMSVAMALESDRLMQY